MLSGDETCNTKGHEAVDLQSPSGRGKLDDEVWGPDSRARRLREMAKGGSAGGAAGLLDGCSGGDCSGAGSIFDACEGASGAGEALAGVLIGILVIVVAAILGALIWFLIKAIVRAIRAWRDVPKPHGALVGPPKASRQVQAAGTVKTGTPIATPWRSGKCLAYAFELHEKRVFGGGAMLRDAQTAGFEITLDDGRILRVPEGRVRILGDREKEDVEKERMTTFLEGIDPRYGATKERNVFPYDHARALTIMPGDRVEVLGQVETAAGGAAGYRENAAVLTPVGVPVLRVRRGKDEPEKRVRVDLDLARVEALEEEAAAEDDPEEEKKRMKM